MNLFHLLFLIAVAFLSVAIYETYRSLKVREGESGDEKRNIKPVIVFTFFLGVILIFASVPGAFFGQPEWFTNKLYWAVEIVIEVFT